ncbi:MAG: bifunctional precorrin-2 dehydrogenase/sirohydrochlorin ferrochelatase [Nitrososphaerota archaeon]
MRMPFFIEMSGKTVLIIGGGEEGFKRAEKYCKTGARIIVYSRSFDERILELASRRFIELVEGDVVEEEKLEKLVKESDIVMVTLDTREHNEYIKKIVEKHKRLLNLANDAFETDLVVPIDTSVGPFRVALTTEGKSSMVAREALYKIREVLEKDMELHLLAELMHRLKKILKEANLTPKKRMEIYRRVYSDQEFRRYVKTGDIDSATKKILEILKENSVEIGEGL